MKIGYDDLVKYLKEKEADFEEISQPLYNKAGMAEWIYDISVDGDWKHSHGYLRYLMEQIGYTETRNDITYEDGSDWYSSVHRFVLNEAFNIFK